MKKFILGLKLKALHNLVLVYWSTVFFSAMTPCSHSHITHTQTNTGYPFCQTIFTLWIFVLLVPSSRDAPSSRVVPLPSGGLPILPGDQAGVTTGSLVYHQHGFIKWLSLSESPWWSLRWANNLHLTILWGLNKATRNPHSPGQAKNPPEHRPPTPLPAPTFSLPRAVNGLCLYLSDNSHQTLACCYCPHVCICCLLSLKARNMPISFCVQHGPRFTISLQCWW